MDLNKLTQDACAAKHAAESACAEASDVGSCNLDGTFLPLPKGQRAGPVVAALRAAGLSGAITSWIGRGILISPPGTGQAGKRYAANEAMREHLHSAGWPVVGYYQMD